MLLNPQSLPALKQLVLIPASLDPPSATDSWNEGISLLAPQLESFTFATGESWSEARVHLPWDRFDRLKRLFLEAFTEDLSEEIVNLVNLSSTSLETLHVVLDRWFDAQHPDYRVEFLDTLTNLAEQEAPYFPSGSTLRNIVVANSSRGDFFVDHNAEEAGSAWRDLKRATKRRGIDLKFSRKFQSDIGGEVMDFESYQDPWAQYVLLTSAVRRLWRRLANASLSAQTRAMVCASISRVVVHSCSR